MLETLRREWAVIRGAPWSAAILMGVACAAGAGVTAALFQHEVSTIRADRDLLKDRLDAGEGNGSPAATRGGRHLTASQVNALAGVLATRVGHAAILSELGAPESGLYARDIASAFGNAGWTVSGGVVGGPARVARAGLALYVGDPAHLTPFEQIVRDAFDRATVPYELLRATAQPDGVQILVNAAG